MTTHINAKLLKGDVVLNSKFQKANPDLMANILGQMTDGGVNIPQFTAGGVGDFLDPSTGEHTFGDELGEIKKRGGVVNAKTLAALRAGK